MFRRILGPVVAYALVLAVRAQAEEVPTRQHLQGLHTAGDGAPISYPDAGHFETYERAYRDPKSYNWVLSHIRFGT